jgi:hypothetical protein
MFGQQPNPAAQASQVSNVLDAYMDNGQQAPQAQPAPTAPPMMAPPMMAPPMMAPPMMAPPMMAPPMMPQAPNFSQMRQEDPRMQAMRHMQRYRRGM